MTIKVTAIMVSVCAVLLYVFATVFPNDPYFYLISSNTAVVIGRLILSVALVYLAFRKKFFSVYGHYISGGLAVSLAVFGMIGLMIPPLTYSLFNYLKPLDYIFMIETGIMFGLAAITYERGTNRLPRLSRPRNTQLRLFSPHSLNARSD